MRKPDLPPCRHATLKPGCGFCDHWHDPGFRRHHSRRMASRFRRWWVWWTRPVRLAKAVTVHVAHGCPVVTPEVKAARLAICVGCGEFDAEKSACRQCGCNLSAKTAWAQERCPVGKW